MKKIKILIVVIATVLVTSLGAQQQAAQELPTYTTEQRWERASSQLTVILVAGIAYAKSIGQSPEEYGEFLGNLFAPGWGEPGSGSVKIIRGVRRNYLMWPEAEFEITESTELSVTARTNRPWAKYFGEDHTWYGVTLDEFDACLHVFNRQLAEYLGLQYQEQIKDGWLYITFSKMK